MLAASQPAAELNPISNVGRRQRRRGQSLWWGCAFLGLVVTGTAQSGAVAQDGDGPLLRELLELNGEAIFGGQVHVSNGRMTVAFRGREGFDRGFKLPLTDGKSGFIADCRDIDEREVCQRLVAPVGDTLTVVGLHSGAAMSRFELVDDFQVSFCLRLEPLSPRASFDLAVNRRGKKEFIELKFLHKIRVVSREEGKRTAASKDSKFRGPPSTWFDRGAKQGMPFLIRWKDSELTVLTVAKSTGKGSQVAPVEIVSMVGIDAPTRGKIGFRFSGLHVAISSLVVEGKIPEKWVRRQIKKLRKAGTLKEVDPVEVAAKPQAQQKEAQDKRERLKKSQTRSKLVDPKFDVDIDDSDPEIDVEL